MTHHLILGANRGIGLQLARQLSARGDRVTAVCRSESGELSALPVEVISGIDLSDTACLERLDTALEGENIDVLVHVAGILDGDTLDSASLDSMRRHFEINALAPFAAIRQLRHRVRDGGKIFILSSRVGSIADNSSGGNYAYRVSKTAVNMIGMNLAHDLEPRDIAVILLHPGYVRTDMTGHTGHMDADESAAGLIEQMDRLTIKDSGSFWHANGEALQW
jgi:NAD(P)-dependent dehydrogenase (short-subunit alcohol dehydrogenase family)